MRGELGESSGAAHPSAGSPPALWRTAGLALGAVLAVAATVVVFLTDDPQILRLAVVGGAWAFVLALLAAGRRRGGADDGAGPGRARELELAREAAGRREHEQATDNRLRREADDAMRAELTALRREVAGLTALRSDVAALGALRSDVAALGALRSDVAALGALRSDVAALGALRQEMAALGALREDVARVADARTELGQLADLRADVGRLRAELTEQLSSEMFLERVVMRTQSSRGPLGTGPVGTVEGPSTRTIESVSWSDETPRELSGGWPAVRLDAPAPQPVAPEVHRPEPVAEVHRPEPGAEVRPPEPAPGAPVTRGYEALQGIRAQQQAHVQEPVSPIPDSYRAPVPADSSRRRRRTDDAPPAEQLTVEQPLASVQAVSELDAWPRPPAPLPPEPLPPEPLPPEPLPVEPLTVQTPAIPTPGEARLAQILAESRANAAASGRRRHRYRDDDEEDDVLARVLGRH
ncbi:DUF6779 domain-containing protein [Trujillonella endophytica]|uniref:DUF6779 domain-containing protein n=1 Tax=Trujillonella endophytica TaxID=673521 RepID=A0A1H8V039_9ACTN|nr:DUF6779 domain-containing protein [Trujillella endophytica]SEP08842.1 hypothetical protein SAMN05660991_03178 [Trujillella endophytica]